MSHSPISATSWEQVTSTSERRSSLPTLQDATDSASALGSLESPRPTNASAVPLDVPSIQEAKRFTEELCGGDSFEVEIGLALTDAVHRALPTLFSLQQAIPKRLEGLKHGVLQVRDTLGARVSEILVDSNLDDTDIKALYDIILEIKTQLYGTSLRSLKSKVEEASGTSKEYGKCIDGQEKNLMGSIQNTSKLPSMQLRQEQPTPVTCWSCFLGISPPRSHYRAAGERGSPLPKGHRNLAGLLRMKDMGSCVTKYLQTLEEDLAFIQRHEESFQHLAKQIQHFKQSYAGRAMDSSKLGMALMEWDLPDCAEVFVEKSISVTFFLEMTKADFEAMGFTDLTLRRLLQAQGNMRKHNVEIRRKSMEPIGASKDTTFKLVLSSIEALQQKYRT